MDLIMAIIKHKSHLIFIKKVKQPFYNSYRTTGHKYELWIKKNYFKLILTLKNHFK